MSKHILIRTSPSRSWLVMMCTEHELCCERLNKRIFGRMYRSSSSNETKHAYNYIIVLLKSNGVHMYEYMCNAYWNMTHLFTIDVLQMNTVIASCSRTYLPCFSGCLYRPRDCWWFFVYSRLGSEVAEKVWRFHIADNVAGSKAFRDKLISLLRRLEYDGAYRATLKSLEQSGSKSVAA